MVTEETRQRILDAVSELHYSKRQAKGRKLVRIGLFITKTERDEFDDPYFRDIRQGILDELNKRKLKVETLFHLGEVLDPVKLRGLDALIIVGPLAATWVSRIQKLNANLVVIDDYDVPAGVDAVFPDFSQAVDEVLTRMVAAGHERISFIGGYAMTWLENGTHTINPTADLRYQAYMEWMRVHQLGHYADAYVGDWTYAGGVEQAQKLLAHHQGKQLPSALLVASDPLAVGVYRVLNQAGIRVPKDIAIVSFDDSDAAAFMTPSLSSVRLHPNAIGRSAVRLAMERVNGERDYPVRTLLPPRVIYRESFPLD